MSLATRCPACGTIFRVVQDQLKVSEGWVRCGQCHEVFHGIEALFDLDSDPGIAARRAARHQTVVAPPTRVFADQRASAPIPMPVTPPPPAVPVPPRVTVPPAAAAPVTAPAPARPADSVRATPSAFGAPPPAPPQAMSLRPGYTGFTPAPPGAVPATDPRPAAPPPTQVFGRSPLPAVATRGTIAPRFAARLAEEAARAQAGLPPAAPAPSIVVTAPVHVPLADVPSGWDARVEAPAPPAAFAPPPAPALAPPIAPVFTAPVATAVDAAPAALASMPPEASPRFPAPAAPVFARDPAPVVAAPPAPAFAPSPVQVAVPGPAAIATPSSWSSPSASAPLRADAAPLQAPAAPPGRTSVFEAPAGGASAPAPAPAQSPSPAPAPAPAASVATLGASPPVGQGATPVAPDSRAADLAAAFAAPADSPAAEPSVLPEDADIEIVEPAPEIGGTTMPSLLADDAADDARAGPPTLASMLPDDAGDWPPRRPRKRAEAAGDDEFALVDRRKDPRFLREARSGARWRRPWVRALLGVMLLALVAAAAGQVAWPLRDTLAARFPATLPAWNQACALAGCTIEAPRSIASLALDGSSLTRTETEHVLLFSADLHNRADHAVRMPSFDVTFMDLNGEIVARKVLSPGQLGIRQDALPPEGELHVHARLQVGALPASGFQADLFYP